MKTELDKCTREKLKRRSKEVQEDLLQDLFFMKQIADDEEETAKCEKKVRIYHYFIFRNNTFNSNTVTQFSFNLCKFYSLLYLVKYVVSFITKFEF